MSAMQLATKLDPGFPKKREHGGHRGRYIGGRWRSAFPRRAGRPTMRNFAKYLGFLAVSLSPQLASATRSAELYTAQAYGYGRVEARVRFAAGDGVVSSVFLWKDGSERAGTFWNELDIEKVGADCRMETNPIYGNPAANHTQKHALALDLCGAFHTYAYEWTPEAIVWLVDGAEVRRETGAIPQAFADNASAGMQIHFNLWPGDASFGGNFSPSILPVHEYLDWVQFSAYEAGTFEVAWREDFNGTALPTGWLTGSWASPKNHSTHAAENVSFIGGYAVLSLTADDALGPAGAMPESSGSTSGGSGGSTSPGPVGGAPSSGGAVGAAGNSGGGAASTAGTPAQAGDPQPRDSGCGFAPAQRKSSSLAALAALTLAFLRAAGGRRRATGPSSGDA